MAGDCSHFNSVQTGSGVHLLVSAIAGHVHGGKEAGCVKLNFHLHPYPYAYMSCRQPVLLFNSHTILCFVLAPECLKILKAYY